MPSLKTLRNRIGSVKSTQKITSAMKMVAASKLKRAQGRAEANRPYASQLEQILLKLRGNSPQVDSGPRLMIGTGADQIQRLIIISSDRGLCGGFNSTLFRYTREKIKDLESQGKKVQIITIGRKIAQLLRRDYNSMIVASYSDFGKQVQYSQINAIAQSILDDFSQEKFDTCQLIFNEFVSVIQQDIKCQQLIPLPSPDQMQKNRKGQNQNRTQEQNSDDQPKAIYEFEPNEETLLEQLLPMNFKVQLFKAVLESAASEQGARMTAMDNATRNAGDMIKKLTINYNRSRQAIITKELIEIISGAEAV